MNATIDSNPPFIGKERHFLRAQIARITHATSLIPKGLMEIDEEGKEKFSEEFNVPGSEELKALETWSHAHPMILQAGRVKHALSPDTNPESAEEEMAKLNEKDPSLEGAFRAINEDLAVTGLPAGLETGFAWISKVVGDT